MKLVVCIDGTWNEASTRTNVWKLKQDLDCSGDTQATYIEGIGTVTGDELLGGMFAADFDRPLGLAERRGLKFVNPAESRPSQYDFASIAKIHNEETPLDPIKPRTFIDGEFIDPSVRDRIKTQEGYFPAIASVPTTLVDWLQGLVAYPLRALT